MGALQALKSKSAMFATSGTAAGFRIPVMFHIRAKQVKKNKRAPASGSLRAVDAKNAPFLGNPSRTPMDKPAGSA
jgi:hypothetical protein